MPLLTFRPEERTSAPVPHCMGDHAGYILGLKEVKAKDNFDYAKEMTRNEKTLTAFKRCRNLFNILPDNSFVQAIHAFYKSLVWKQSMLLNMIRIGVISVSILQKYNIQRDRNKWICS